MPSALGTTGFVKKFFLAIIAVAVAAPSGRLVQPARTEGQKISACSLLTREEVKKLVPWSALVDQIKTEEDPLSNGSSCTYPNTIVQVLSQSAWRSFIDIMRKGNNPESVAGVGDEAYIRDNRHEWAELVAKVGTHVLTIQHDLNEGETLQAAKPRVVALAKAFAAKLH